MNILKKYIESNKSFYRKKNYQDKKKIILFLVSKDIHISSLTMKFSKAVSDVLKKELLVVPNLSLSFERRKLINSFKPSMILNFRLLLLKSLTKNLRTLLRINKNLSSGDDLLNLEIKKTKIGHHIYDYLLAKFDLTSIEKINFSHRISILIDLLYFFSSIEIISSNEDPLIILPDNVYRHGTIFEYVKKHNLKCLAGLSMTEFTIHKFDDAKSYDDHCRTPSIELVENLIKTPVVIKEAEKYFSNRIEGLGYQHDSIRAFAPNKKELSKKELIKLFNLDSNKPIVLVAAHIFKDAPHGLPNLLFKDFSIWLKETCIELDKNKKVNFIIKEHPTSELYEESGKTLKILDEINMKKKLLPNFIKTSSLFESIDFMITCGGTAAMEFAYFGVPSLLASKPPYSNFGFSDISNSKEEYLKKIKKIHEFNNISSSDRTRALVLLFLFNNLQRLDNLEKVIGTQKVFMGMKIDLEKFLSEMIEDNSINSGYKSLKDNLKIFFNQKERNLMNNNLIQNMQIKKV